MMGVEELLQECGIFKRHESRKHENSTFSEHCLLCGKIFSKEKSYRNTLIINHGPSDKFYEKESAFNHNVVTYRFSFEEDQANFTDWTNVKFWKM